MKKMTCSWGCAVVAAMTIVTSVSAGTIRHDRSQSQYLNLGANAAYASVGRIDGSGDGGGWIGSGTLIASNWVLTAAHVVDSASSLTFSVGGASYSATNWIANPGWTGNLNSGHDIALVQLSGPVSNVTAAQRYYGSKEQGKTATYVGYGMSGTGLTGATSFDGKKRAGQNVYDRVYNSRILLSDFDNPSNRRDNVYGSSSPLNLEYAIAPGDSGGGTFLNINGLSLLAGVHSFGAAYDGNVNSDYGDLSGDIRVSAFNSWIDSILAQFGVSGFSLTSDGETLGGTAARFELETSAVPEPASFGLLLLMGAAVLRRR